MNHYNNLDNHFIILLITCTLFTINSSCFLNIMNASKDFYIINNTLKNSVDKTDICRFGTGVTKGVNYAIKCASKYN